MSVLKLVARSPILVCFSITVVAYLALLYENFSGEGSRQISEWADLYSIASSFLISFISAFVIYYLVVAVPTKRRRTLLRENQLKMYRGIKNDLLVQILSASINGGRRDISITGSLVEKLMSPPEFRKFFEGGRLGTEGFYAFANHIQGCESDFKVIVFKLKLIARQLDFLVRSIEIRDAALFDHLRNIEQSLFELDALSVDYDDVKCLVGIIWMFFAGWSAIEGYRDGDNQDLIERAINEI